MNQNHRPKSGQKKSISQHIEHVRAASRQSSALGSLVSTAANVAKSIPVIGSVVDTAETVASSILSFLGLGSSLFSVHYLCNGHRICQPHSGVNYDSKSAIYSSPNTTVSPGDILLRYQLSIGPTGSRSRRMGENFEKYVLNAFQLYVTASCASTEPGQLAYLYVPDPSDRTLDSMNNTTRLEAVLGRDNVQLAQMWQNTVLTFRPGQKEYFVQPTGDDRLASPGAIYVIAVTAVDPLKLPTLRQTSSLTFRKAASAPSVADVEVCLADVSEVKGTGGPDYRQFALAANIRNFNPKRFEVIAADGDVLAPSLVLSAGEVAYITVPDSLPEDIGLISFSFRESEGGEYNLPMIANASECDPLPELGWAKRSAACFLCEAKESGYLRYNDYRAGQQTTLPTEWTANRITIVIFPNMASSSIESSHGAVSSSVALSSHRFENGVRCARPIPKAAILPPRMKALPPRHPNGTNPEAGKLLRNDDFIDCRPPPAATPLARSAPLQVITRK